MSYIVMFRESRPLTKMLNGLLKNPTAVIEESMLISRESQHSLSHESGTKSPPHTSLDQGKIMLIVL